MISKLFSRWLKPRTVYVRIAYVHKDDENTVKHLAFKASIPMTDGMAKEIIK